MDASDAALPILSVVEAFLYLRVTPCRACAGGPLREGDHRAVSYDAKEHLLTCPVTCKACGYTCAIRLDTREIDRDKPFSGDLREAIRRSDPLTARAINPTPEPSRIIDLAGWLTLHSMMVEQARTAELDLPGTAGQRSRVRWLRLRAAQCLAEALKFYEPDNDLPPEDAFYGEDSRRQFRELPELFTRQRLIELRARLPHLRDPSSAER